MSESYEMESKASSSAPPPLNSPHTSSYSEKNPVLREKVLRKAFELRPASNRSISYCWVLFPVLSYLTALVGGIITCIGVGNTFAAFDDFCLFNANFTLQIKQWPDGSKTLKNRDIISWGDRTDCLFAEYASVSLALFSGVWLVMILQCGRGGASRRGFRLPDAWRIVPPTCVLNAVLFVISCLILSRVSRGFESFCDNVSVQWTSDSVGDMKLSCDEILSFKYIEDKYHTDLLQQSRISVIGATVQFVGCLVSFLVVILRCCTGPDFDLYVRREIQYIPANTDDEPENDGDKICLKGEDYEDDDDDEDEEDYLDNNKSRVTNVEVVCHPQPSIDQRHSPIGNDEEDKNSITSTTVLIN